MARLHLNRKGMAGVDLPSVCIRCGSPAARWRTAVLYVRPPWTPWVFLALVNPSCGTIVLLPALLVAGAATQVVRLDAPLCGIHANHFRNRRLLDCGAVLLGCPCRRACWPGGCRGTDRAVAPCCSSYSRRRPSGSSPTPS